MMLAAHSRRNERFMPPRQATSTQQDDTALLDACLAGDQHAWDTLVQRYTRLIYSIALSSGLAEHDSADVVQNVFTIVLRRLESLQHPDRFSAWLITTARRESWRVKRNQREETVDGEIDAPAPDPTADSLVIEWEHAASTYQALEQLDERCRRLVQALFLHDDRPSYDAIAAELGIAVGSIGPIRARCLERLRSNLAEVGIVDART